MAALVGHKRCRGSPWPRKVVVLRGGHFDLHPLRTNEDSISVRSSVAPLLEMGVARVATNSGGKVVGGIPDPVAERALDPENPQHVTEYAAEIFSGFRRKGSRGALAPFAIPVQQATLSPSPGRLPSCKRRRLRQTFAACVCASPASPTCTESTVDTSPWTPPGRKCADVDRQAQVDWIIVEGTRLDLRMETVFLTIAVLDSYLAKCGAFPGEMRLIGATSLLIAAKFEEIYPPEIQELLGRTRGGHTAEQLKHMEVQMLTVLGFQICGQTSAHYLQQYLGASLCTDAQCRLARYVVELALVDGMGARQAPFRLAASAVMLVCCATGGRLPPWPASMEINSGQPEAAVLECASTLQELVRQVGFGSFRFIMCRMEADPDLRDSVRLLESTEIDLRASCPRKCK